MPDNSVEIRFGASTDEAIEGIGKIRDALADLGGQIKLLQQSLSEKKLLLNAEVSQFQITQNQKFALLQAETQKEYEAQTGAAFARGADRRPFGTTAEPGPRKYGAA